MFNIGDKVVYPSQGIGVISDIEKIEFKGEKQDYYKIKIFNNTMILRLPVSRAEVSNLRLISDSEVIDRGLEYIGKVMSEKSEYDEATSNEFTSKERMATNSQKIKSGAFRDSLDVICDLIKVKSKGKLNSGDKQVLKNAKDFVIKEISCAKGISIEDSTDLLKNAIKY